VCCDACSLVGMTEAVKRRYDYNLTCINPLMKLKFISRTHIYPILSLAQIPNCIELSESPFSHTQLILKHAGQVE
jgi:hypothetical protein